MAILGFELTGFLGEAYGCLVARDLAGGPLYKFPGNTLSWLTVQAERHARHRAGMALGG